MAVYNYNTYQFNQANGKITNDPVVSQAVDDADGVLTVGSTFDIGGTTYTVTGVFSGPSNTTDFTATAGGTSFFFTQGTYAQNFDVDGIAGYTTTSGASVSLTCFLPGTLIATERGDVAIEDLVIGDRLPTSDGTFTTVRWVTRQTIAAPFSPRLTTYPVCISAGALGDGLPRRDLFVSPGHAMYVDGRLVMAGALINGSSIYQVAQMPARFEYLHVETEGHRVIFAEGAATESYVDKSPRQNFDNWVDYVAMYPDWKPIKEMDVPIVEARRLLPAETRDRLAAIAKEMDYAKKIVA